MENARSIKEIDGISSTVMYGKLMDTFPAHISLKNRLLPILLA